MSPNLPARLGRYEVIDLIGLGAFATVFRARDDRLESEVAVKVLAENHSFDADLRERFITEGHLLRRVDSPHVVTVFDLDETDAGQPFLVLELATAGDLRARRRTAARHGIGPDQALAVAEQVALALGALHAKQVVHRDVSPGNLLITSSQPLGRQVPEQLLGREERLILADLGLSKDLAVASGLTVGAGTAGFTPPEQGQSGWIDPRADIWSASALVVWVGLGRGPDAEGRWRADLAESRWPPAVVHELERGLATSVQDRHGNAEDWAAALRAANEVPSRAARPATPADPNSGGADPAGARPARSRLRVAMAAVAAVAVAVALVGAGWWFGRGTGTRTDVSTQRLGGGRVRVTARSGAVTVAAVGPDVVPVGSTATYDAEVTGVSHYVWFAPDGQPYTDEAKLVVQPTSAGATEVRLVGLGPAGEVVTSELPIDVREGS